MTEIRPNIGRRWITERPWYWEGATWSLAYEYFFITPGTQFEFNFGVEE